MNAEELVQRAREARGFAYAPFSQYSVGAALVTRSGRVFTGSNVENSSYGLTICAERVAVFKAVSEGEREISAIAVVASTGASMCGACRQVLSEFGSSITVYLAAESGRYSTTTLAELLPAAFRLRRDE